MVNDLIVARGAAAEGKLGREFFLNRLEEPLHALENQLLEMDATAGERLSGAISLVESAIDGHLAIEGRPKANFEAVESLTIEVCQAFLRLEDAMPKNCGGS